MGEMERIALLVILAVSTACCVVNVVFYTRLWWRDRNWVTGILALISPPFLVSRLLEIQKLCAEWMGYSYASPDHARIVTGLLGLALCGTLSAAVVIKFWPLLRDQEERSKARDGQRVREDK